MHINNQILNKAAENFVVNEFWQQTFPKILASGLAAGVGVRSLSGMGELLSHNLRRTPDAPEPTMINIPYRPVPQHEQRPEADKRLRRVSMNKAANLEWMQDFLGGEHARSAWSYPMAYPAAILGALGTAYGGYKLTDKLIQNRKQKMLDEELNDARSEYHQALMRQFRPISGAKIKSAELSNPEVVSDVLDNPDNVVGQDLDKLANIMDEMGGWARAGAGAYLGLAPLLMLGTGIATHKYLQSMGSGRNDEAEALRAQINERATRHPPEVFAQLLPVDEQGNEIDMNKKRNQRLYGPHGGIANGQDKMGSADDKSRELNARAAAFVAELLGQ